jgi:two-component system, chemotaxis family, response regulator Rcp1
VAWLVGVAFGENGMPFEILLVDDNAGDVRLLREAFSEVDDSLHLHVASDGVEAVAFLEQEGDHSDAPRPDLILLDLNLPRMDGREVLARIKADDRLRQIPTLVLSISDAEADVAKVYHLQANCYLIKPVEWDEFVRLVKSIKDFWLTTAKLPPKNTRG